jgi:hypothetical protein
MPTTPTTSDGDGSAPLLGDGVYRVRAQGAPPKATLAIRPRLREGGVAYFDTLRDRTLRGRVSGHEGDAVLFERDDGSVLRFEPLTLERYQEIRPDLEAPPELASDEEVRQFFLAL